MRAATARERIDRAAYELFTRHGVRAVGVDDVIAHSGVAKATLYRHYPTKTHLALAFLRRREELWTRSWLQIEVERRRRSPVARLLAVFDVFESWFRRPGFEGCTFVKVLLGSDAEDPVIRSAALGHLGTIRSFLERLAREAGAREPVSFAWKWHILMKGSIVAAAQGDRDAARRAGELGRLLLASEGMADTPVRRARA